MENTEEARRALKDAVDADLRRSRTPPRRVLKGVIPHTATRGSLKKNLMFETAFCILLS